MVAGQRQAPLGSVEVALEWARSQIGIREDPPGSARGLEIDAWQRACGVVGYPWCGAFVAAALREAGLDVPREIVWTPTLIEWARAEEHGFTFHSWQERAPGDLVLFSFGDHEREVNHVGLLDLDSRHTIEGNTTVDGSGDADHGGRRRPARPAGRRRRRLRATVLALRPGRQISSRIFRSRMGRSSTGTAPSCRPSSFSMYS